LRDNRGIQKTWDTTYNYETELEAIEEEMSESDTTSENDSNTDEEAEEEYWQRAEKTRESDDEETCDFATVALYLP